MNFERDCYGCDGTGRVDIEIRACPHESARRGRCDGSGTLALVDEGEPIVELLAALEHDQWEAWSRRVADEEDLSTERMGRWRSYWVPYEDLPDDVKEYDREYARQVLSLLDNRGLLKEGAMDEVEA